MKLDPATVAAFQAEVDRQGRSPAPWDDPAVIEAFTRAAEASARVDAHLARLRAAALDFARAEVRRQLAARRQAAAPSSGARSYGGPLTAAPEGRAFGLRFGDGAPLILDCDSCGEAQGALTAPDATGRRALVCSRCGRPVAKRRPPPGLRRPLTTRPILTGFGR